MFHVKHTVQSPINPENTLEDYFSCMDHTVSKESFLLLKDVDSDLLITTPQPKKQDLGKYYISEAYISHTDSAKSIFDKVYQVVKKYAINNKITVINNLLKPVRKAQKVALLDIGCGTGDFLVACANQKWEVTGVEPNTQAKEFAKNKLKNINHILVEDISDVLETKQFDIITMWHVLEHVPNLTEYIAKLKTLLKPNGVILIAVPNYKSFDANYYKEFWAAYDVPRHLWHFSQKAITQLFSKQKMHVIKTLPMKFDSFYVSLLSEKIKTGKSNPIIAFFIGLQSNWKAKHTTEYSSLIYCIKNIKS